LAGYSGRGPSLCSGFRQKASASLTPSDRLKFGAKRQKERIFFAFLSTRTIINPAEVFFRRRISVVTQPTAAPPVRVEIYDQVYNLRGVDAEYIMKLAEFVDGKMRTVGEQTSTIDSLRLAVLAALNIADEYHILKKKCDLLAGEFNRRAGQLAGALDEVLQDERRAG